VTVSLFGSENQVGFGLLVAPQNRWREVSAGHASRFSSLLRMETSLAKVSQSGLKNRGTMMGGACDTITKTGESMRQTASDPATLPLLFSMY
jgi:hypothetical protein